MKHSIKYLISILFLLPALFTLAQSRPNNSSQPQPTAPVAVLPPVLPGGVKLNVIKQWTPLSPQQDETVVAVRPVEEVALSSQFSDGLGRQLQVVERQSSPQKKDAVITNLYDEQGRERYTYIPFASPGADGLFKLDAFEQQKQFMQGLYDPNGNGEKVYYGEKVFDNSPLNRPLKTMSPGNSWAGSGRGAVLDYGINSATEKIVKWNIADTPGSLPVFAGYYDAGQLTKVTLTDENGRSVIEYTDKDGHKILRKLQHTQNPGADHTGWLCSYYVYDPYQQLRAVLPPKAVEQTAGSWSITTTQADELCYRYEYDKKGRMILKKMPGIAEHYTVYDDRDRPVLFQDGNLRTAGKWQYTQYDEQNRMIATGLWVSGLSFAQQLSSAALYTGYPFAAPAGFTNYEELTRTFYDNYNRAGVKSYDASYAGFLSPGTNAFPEPVMMSSEVNGLVTGRRVKVLGQNKYLTTTIYYDNKERPIQMLADNLNGGTTITTTRYNFSGKIISTCLHQTNPGFTPAELRVLTRTEYDHGQRAIAVYNTINNGPERRIAAQNYSQRGNLQTKLLGSNPLQPGTPLETITYDYNIRTWLSGINKKYVEEYSSNKDHFFGEAISYDYGFSDAADPSGGVQYSGNIAGIKWRGKSDDEARAYGYGYDKGNRLTKADFTQYTAGNWNTSAGIDFSVSGAPENGNVIGYDANGNLLSLFQKGVQLNSSGYIDQLRYTYIGAGNKLLRVKDDISPAGGNRGDFRDGSNGAAADDYAYDDNGNMLRDGNKEMVNPASPGQSAIQYNYLNLPEEVFINGKGTIRYVYDATGSKLQKIVTQTAAPAFTRVTDYTNGVVYDNGVLQYIPHEEGRVRYIAAAGTSPEQYVYDYYIKDHTGNIRPVITEQQRKDTYPIATMEDADAANQNAYLDNVNIPAERDLRPDNFGNDVTNGYYARKLNKTDNAVGPGKLLKVMAKDKIGAAVQYYYNTHSVNNSNANGLSSLITGLVNIINGIHGPGILKGNGAALTSGYPANPVLTTFLNAQTPASPDSKPKAYLNILFFDEQLKFIPDGSVFAQVSNQQGALAYNAEAPKSGYAYIYVSNESNSDVYFDNLAIVHDHGPIVQETHYYPFGLTMAGISSEAPGYAISNDKYNGKELQSAEFSDGTGLNWYDYGARMYDVQTARWQTFDPKAEASRRCSPYAYAYNNPVIMVDPDGMQPTGNDPGFTQYFKNFVQTRSPNNSEQQEKKMTDAERAYIYMLWQTEQRLSPLSEKVQAVGEVLGSFVPFVDAVKEASNGNYVTAAIFAVTDIAGGSIERGAVKAAAKVAEKFIVKEVEQTAVREAERFVVREGAEEGYRSFNAFKRAYGPAGPGQAWHHIVEQNPTNILNFGNPALHNTGNLIRLEHGAGTIHARISGYYSSKDIFTGTQTVRQWLSGQSFQEQYDFGIQMLNKFGWKP